MAIDHKKGIPYWPQNDGKVERFNKTLLKIIRIAQLQGKNWKGEVQDFLFHYCSTPHTVTRKLRDKLSQVRSPGDQATEADWQIILRKSYAQRKLREKEYADSETRHDK